MSGTDKRCCRSAQDLGWSIEISQEWVRDGTFCLGGEEGEGRETQRSLRVKACSCEERPSGCSAEDEQPEFCKNFSVTR